MIAFTIPVPEKVSSNKAYSGFKHWSVRKKLKDLYHTYMMQFKGKYIVDEFPVRITYSFEWKSRPLDTTNQFFMIKLIEDGMVHAGILPDDSIAYVYETTSRSQKGEEDVVTVSIESM